MTGVLQKKATFYLHLAITRPVSPTAGPRFTGADKIVLKNFSK